MERIFMFVVFTKYHLGGKIKKNERGADWVTYGGQEKFIQSFGVENWGERQLGRTMRW